MTLTEFFKLITEAVFLLIGVATFIEWLRWRDRPRLDITLVFTSFSIIFLFQNFSDVTGLELRWLSIIGGVTLIAHPYLLLRVVDHFRRPSPWVHRLALLGLLVSTAIVVFATEDLPPLEIAVVGVYFVGVEGYAAAAFVLGARRAAGVPRLRLTLAAVGSGLLAGLILLALVAPAFPALADTVAILNQLVAIVAGLCYFLGFAPPRVLRRAWQLPELYHFLQQTSQQSTPEDVDAVLDSLRRAAVRAVGGEAASVALWDETSQTLQLRRLAETQLLTNTGGVIQRIWTEKRPASALPVSELVPEDSRRASAAGAVLIYVAPIAAGGRPWRGLLLVFRAGPSPFAADDLQLLTLLAEQSASALDYVALIGEQRRLISELEQRTAQLEAVNRELETFSYSVSHDLRAPLRGLAGFSQALLEDYGDKLDAQGQDFLRRIRVAAGRMGELIDGLLEMSRVARAELRREKVDLGVVARSVAEDLQRSEPNRVVDFAIAESLMAVGDARLLRLVLENLLGNAWKFTSKVERAHIELGASKMDGHLIYYVRDNGAGFDNAHAGQLFVAFQRLHQSAEFPGTGIGLATVERIISRHGGLICADGAAGRGAAFYFTLP